MAFVVVRITPVSPEPVPGMAEKIEARRLELDLSLQEFADKAGVTRQGLSPYRKGLRRGYQDQAKRGVARALRWRHDAIDRLLAGLDPVPLEDEFLEKIARQARHSDPRGSDFKPDLVVALEDGTQVVIEVRGKGKIREAEVLQEVNRLLRPLYPPAAEGHIGKADLATAAAGAQLAVARTRGEVMEDEDDPYFEALKAAAHGADAEHQEVEERGSPRGEVPVEQGPP